MNFITIEHWGQLHCTRSAKWFMATVKPNMCACSLWLSTYFLLASQVMRRTSSSSSDAYSFLCSCHEATRITKWRLSAMIFYTHGVASNSFFFYLFPELPFFFELEFSSGSCHDGQESKCHHFHTDSLQCSTQPSARLNLCVARLALAALHIPYTHACSTLITWPTALRTYTACAFAERYAPLVWWALHTHYIYQARPSSFLMEEEDCSSMHYCECYYSSQALLCFIQCQNFCAAVCANMQWHKL